MARMPLGARVNVMDAPKQARDGELTIRGLLHDLGHQMMTLSLLAESVQSDHAMPADSRRRMQLVIHEMLRAIDMIADSITAGNAGQAGGESSIVDVRGLASDVAQLTGLAYDSTVTMLPGRAATIRIPATVLWRVLANLVDNAVRAAGPGGRVDISVEQAIDAVIEIADDGPGFGSCPAGTAGLGISVVQQLLEHEGGRLEVAKRPGGGTSVRVIFGIERDYRTAPVCA